jgi:uncharacterized membrane protein YgdD (TMEM256/DUF423 family)
MAKQLYVRGCAYALRGAGVFRMVWPMHRPLFTLAAILGALSVILGAFGAHGLTKHLAPLADGALRLEWWKTAAHYHLTHALAVGLAAGLFGQVRLGRMAAWSFTTGIVVFAGSLYAMSLTGVRWLGAVTPIGGVALIAGWILLAVAAQRYAA